MIRKAWAWLNAPQPEMRAVDAVIAVLAGSTIGLVAGLFVLWLTRL